MPEAGRSWICVTFKKNKIDLIKGWGKIVGPGKISVNSEIYNSKSIIVATGSEPSKLSGLKIDEKKIVTSTGALTLDKIPESMAIVGAGVIGLELGSVYSRLGSKVTVIEYLDEIAPSIIPSSNAQSGSLSSEFFCSNLTSIWKTGSMS